MRGLKSFRGLKAFGPKPTLAFTRIQEGGVRKERGGGDEWALYCLSIWGLGFRVQGLGLGCGRVFFCAGTRGSCGCRNYGPFLDPYSNLTCPKPKEKI